jgi:hypothetical protein
VEEWLCSPLFTPSMPSSDDLDDPDWRDPSSLLSCMELAGKYGESWHPDFSTCY